MYPMKKHHSTRLLCILLCFTMLLSGCLTGTPDESSAAPATSIEATAPESTPATIPAPPETVPESPAILDVPEENIPAHSDVLYADMVYERPDLDAFYDNTTLALSFVGEEASEQLLFETYDTLPAQLNEISTMDTLASLKSNMDLSDTYYEDEMTLLDNELTKMDNRMNDVTEAILQSSYADAFTAKYGADFVERYEIYSKLNSPEIEELCEQENDLINEYKQCLSKEYTTIYDGKEVTLNDLDFSDPNVAVPYFDIYAQKNAECADIYLQLVQIRVGIAQILGYDSYTDYAYDSLGRDFTKEDSARFSAMVKEYIVPLAAELNARYQNALAAAYSGEISLSMEDSLIYLQDALAKEFPPAMTEALQYMLDHQLYIFDDSPNMMPAAFSTMINDYAAPFLFVNTGVYTDPSTLFHEFGHYYNFYLMGSTQWNDANNLDLAEIHSQGMEILMFPHYEEIYDENAEAMRIAVLCNLLDNILMGCCEDEFQQKVFENPDMTIDEMNLLHGQLYQEYIGYPLYYEWVDIHHHFETPFYYISYATGAASTFELWELSELSRPAALSAYRSITQNTINCGYLAPLEKAGLSNPFASDMVKGLAEAISAKYLADDRQ